MISNLMYPGRLMNQFIWASSRNYDQFLGSSSGQSLQSVAIALTGVFAAFKAGKAFTAGSYAELIPPVIYGATAFFAWSGKNAVRKLMAQAQILDQAIASGQGEAANIKAIKEQLLEEKEALQLAKQSVMELQNTNLELVEQIKICQNDQKQLESAVADFQQKALRANEEFQKLLIKKNQYKQQAQTFKTENESLQQRVVNLTARVQALTSKPRNF